MRKWRRLRKKGKGTEEQKEDGRYEWRRIVFLKGPRSSSEEEAGQRIGETKSAEQVRQFCRRGMMGGCR